MPGPKKTKYPSTISPKWNLTTPSTSAAKSQTSPPTEQPVTISSLGYHANSLAGEQTAPPTATGNFTAPHPASSPAPQENPANPYNLPPDLLAITKKTPLSPQLIARLLRHCFVDTPPNDSAKALKYLTEVTHRSLHSAYNLSSLYMTYGNAFTARAKCEIPLETQTWMEHVRNTLVENKNPMTTQQIQERFEANGNTIDRWKLYLALQPMETAGLISMQKVFNGNTHDTEVTLMPNGASCPIPTYKPEPDCITVTRAICQYKTQNGEKRPTPKDIQAMISGVISSNTIYQCIRAVYGDETMGAIARTGRKAKVQGQQTSQNPPTASANTAQSSGAPPSVKRKRPQNTQHRPQEHQFAGETGPTVTPGAIPATSSNIPDNLPNFSKDPFPGIVFGFEGSDRVLLDLRTMSKGYSHPGATPLQPSRYVIPDSDIEESMSP